MCHHETDSLSSPHRDAILELGSRGSGGQFDVAVMCELMSLGFVEIRSQDRRLMLTERGRGAYAELTKPSADGRLVD
jgi:hypothetical protein